jgi:hypothetical protein
MANRFIQGRGTTAGDAATELARLNGETAGVAAILFDSVDGILKYYDRVNSVVRQILGNNPQPVSITGSISLTNALHAGRILLLNAAAGGTITLPAATGTGDVYRLQIATALTSATWAINTASPDKFYGGVIINDTGDTTAATADFKPAVGGTSVTITLTQTVGAGVIGDYIELIDVGTAKWVVSGVLVAELDPTTPFS